jgi:NAD(P)-dependent dehydrogenase (short-subunit alcohol dehydrogenase family)
MMHSQHWLGLQGKVCAVTGAASGIGAEVARQLAQAGAKVALLDRNAAGCADIASELTSQGVQVATKGSVVNVASISGLFPQSHSGAYSAGKAGVLLLSRQLAAEWGPQGVRSNAICPGMIRTALSAKFYEEPGFEAKRAAVTASRRIGEPVDIANVALFLASERSGYVNGAEISVDGGMSSMLMDMVPRPGYNQTQ